MNQQPTSISQYSDSSDTSVFEGIATKLVACFVFPLPFLTALSFTLG